jgi:putative transposase
MPRKPRFYLPGIPAHIVQRGHDRQPVFFCDADRHAYLDSLQEGAERYGCAIHAFVLMTNHVHLLVTPRGRTSVSRMMQHLGRKYVAYVNREYSRSGTLWEGRHKGSLIQSERYAMACCHYIEMNPVRAGVVRSPDQYPWSSYCANAYGREPTWLEPLPEYRKLGMTAEDRHEAYRELFDRGVEPVHAIRECAQTGTPWGNAHFKREIELALGKTVGQSRRGRPRYESPIPTR